MIYVNWLLLIVYVLAVVGTMMTVLMDNRQPSKTMAWMLVLVFVPVVGIVLYFFFGQNTRKERLISQQSLDQLTKRSMLEFVEQEDLVLPKEYQTLIRLFANQNWALPFKDNEVDIYTDGYGFFHALLHGIAHARHHIHLESYIFEDDALGYMVADALIEKSKEGVEVRIVYDDVGCWNVKSAFFERMRDAGIEVHAFMPVKFPAFTGKVNYRNHRKLCVIDGAVGFIGGMNIASRYVKGRHGGCWRDTHLRIRGGAVYGIQRTFLVDWYFVDRTLVTNRRYYPDFIRHQDNVCAVDRGVVPVNNCVVQIVTSSPVSQWPDIMQGYVRILLEAKKYVYMETPYFLPTEPVLFAMRTAALGGVDIRLMIPCMTDARFVEWASKSYVRQTVEAGVKVYLYKAGFNHSKLLVADDMLCTCGSTNVDFRSFENNFESNAFIYDRDMALRMKQVILEDFRHCVSLDDEKDFIRSPFLNRLWESSLRLLSPLL
ncbi:MAG: cardiolipin synthase [Prevotellaceae bacterium]|nr:cardiolipin synthase [Prevotella sp.]MDD7258286.1 cardiolipin synthase [Prevotellaceae bacterium]MDY6129955.1 cardiolipin synthase [Prevotella sp.]